MWDGKPSARIPRTTQLAMVRFGNVLGSSGSVVPYFRQQIAQGGPITLTHQDIIRYFMTISEAAQLVMQTSAMANSSSKGIGAGVGSDISDDISDYRKGRISSEAEVYVLDMGKPVKIIDLARRMVELSGFRVKDENTPEGDIAIEVVGLRPGEKLYEELLIGNNPQTTQHPRIMKANEKFLPWSELQPMITTLRIAAVNGDVMMIRSMLQLIVPEYRADAKVVDWVYREQLIQTGRLER
jgi:FlaA1/EpsC-like NDP-sugar epimerase